MSKTLNLARRIRSLKIGQHLFVYSDQDRALARNLARTLRSAGVIEFEVSTRDAVDANGKAGFKVCAI